MTEKGRWNLPVLQIETQFMRPFMTKRDQDFCWLYFPYSRPLLVSTQITNLGNILLYNSLVHISAALRFTTSMESMQPCCIVCVWGCLFEISLCIPKILFLRALKNSPGRKVPEIGFHCLVIFML